MNNFEIPKKKFNNLLKLSKEAKIDLFKKITQ